MPQAEETPPEAHSLWLESLPQHAIDCIVASLQPFLRATPATDTVSLAFASDHLRPLVRNAFTHNLDLLSHDDNDALYQLFASDITRLTVYNDTPHHPAVISFLQAPSLRVVSIPADEHLTAALLVKKTVRDLQLDLGNQNHGDHIKTLLKSLHLTKLSLHCYLTSPVKHCLLNSELSDPNSCNSIADLCPHLEELHTSCTRDDRNSIYWRLLPNLPIKRAILKRNVRKDAWHQLREMETVALRFVKDPVYHAERIGESVTEFITEDLLGNVDLAILHGCPRLEVLHISVMVGSSAELCELVESLPNLRELMLRFNRHTMYSGKRGKTYYESMEDGALLKIIQAVPSLQKLGLYGLQVSGEELEEVLMMLGGSLTKLNTCTKGQSEGMFERLERLLNTLCRYNYRLEEFSVIEAGDTQGLKSNLRRKGKDLAKRRRQQKETGRRLKVLVEALKRRSRFTDVAYGRIGPMIETLL